MAKLEFQLKYGQRLYSVSIQFTKPKGWAGVAHYMVRASSRETAAVRAAEILRTSGTSTVTIQTIRVYVDHKYDPR